MVSVFLICNTSVAEAAGDGFDVFKFFSKNSLEDDRRVFSRIYNVLDKVADEVVLETKKEEKVSGTLIEKFSEKGDSNLLISSSDTFLDAAIKSSSLISAIKTNYDYFRSKAYTQIKSQIPMWSIDAERNSSLGDFVTSLRKKYCSFVGSDFSYNVKEKEKKFSCSEYTSAGISSKKIVDDLVNFSRKAYVGTEKGFMTETSTYFDNPTCADTHSKASLANKNHAFESCPLLGSDNVAKDLNSAYERFHAREVSLRDDFFSFTSIYNNLDAMQKKGIGEIEKTLADSKVKNIAYQNDRFSKKINEDYSAATFSDVSSLTSAHFDKISKVVKSSEDIVYNSVRFRLRAEIAEWFMDDSIKLMQEYYSCIKGEFKALSDIGKDFSNKPMCK